MLNIHDVVQAAFVKARALQPDRQARKHINTQLSEGFVRQLSALLKAGHPGNEFVAFNKHDCSNRKTFGLNEMMHDICLVHCVNVPSPGKAKPLPCVVEVVWQVESELDQHNTREIAQDFNKLPLGSASNKLFIASWHSEQGVSKQKLLLWLLSYALQCSGNVFVSFIPHPKS